MRQWLAILFTALALAGLGGCDDQPEDHRKEAAEHAQKAKEHEAAGNQQAADAERAAAAEADHAARLEEAEKDPQKEGNAESPR
ncbi:MULTISPECIES: hypothetical protein [Pseudomonas]|uniref:Lipoprotein n=2 Tax=Pseudomonas TaxID=286 RepID=A0ABS0MT56_PSELU|nr:MULTISPECIES: hypothetical protein [Pseudomonas]MBA1248687.1 hypothetical protein [Pseudomonas zeshuii]MBH3439905.1 hypothetical protein [Pseudomonas luteola]MBW5412205.1 hypothetical protein [Pseudomonas sp. MAG002Y]MCG7374593.1 hypothetical protein [Pseudomonas luteola]MDN3236143.1 hypothetical protein [Pseudomonas sp. WAC2]